MALVYNCNDDMAVAAFISGLEVTHFYKYLVKHDVTKMRDIFARVQPEFYQSLPQARRESEKQEAQPGPPKKTPNRVVGAINKSARNLTKVHGDEADLTPFKVPVDQVYNAIKC